MAGLEQLHIPEPEKQQQQQQQQQQQHQDEDYPEAQSHAQETEIPAATPTTAVQQQPPPPTPTSVAAEKATELSTKALDFLSNASNEQLGACLVGASAVLYMVLGRVGLLLIGVLVGVALHATWEQRQNSGDGAGAQGAEAEKKRRREVGVDVAKRLLEWQDGRNKAGAEARAGELDARTDVALRVAARQELDFSAYPPQTAKALTELVDAAIRDYVKYWYAPMLPGEEGFPSSARQTLTGFMLALCSHQERKRPADVLLNFMTNATSIFIVFLSELARALMTSEAADLDVSEALNLYLDRSPDSNLASIANEQEQEKKLLAVADDFLQLFLDPKMYNCEPARLFLKQVFAVLILQSTLRSISRPEWINEWIVYLLEEGEPELITAIDAGVEGATNKAADAANAKSQKAAEQAAAEETAARQSVDHAEREKRLSNAADAMEAAMEEAKRLTEMIKVEEATKTPAAGEDPASSAFTTETQVTPTSSQDDLASMNTVDSAQDAPSNSSPSKADPSAAAGQSFTSFDQIVPPNRPHPEPSKPPPPLTLHKAKITIFDDAQPGDKSTLKSKPQTEYLLQIEPASSLHSGWMVPRKYPEVETLHEYLYRIANVTGATTFIRKYQYLPPFKGKTKEAFRQDIERYLCDALTYETIAESEGMKRFLDKDQGFAKSNGKNPLAFAAPVGDAFQTVGKGMLGGFNSATKGVAAGGQAVFDGVGGLFGGHKRTNTATKPNPDLLQTGRSMTDDQMSRSSREFAPSPRASTDLRNNPRVSTDTGSPRQSTSMSMSQESLSRQSLEAAPPALPPRSQTQEDLTKTSSVIGTAAFDETSSSNLPTPPASVRDSVASLPRVTSPMVENAPHPPTSIPTSPTKSLHASESTPGLAAKSEAAASPPAKSSSKREFAPLDEQETRVAIELLFAAINELFTLSSAWQIRRTLLAAAKNYLLRPGNPSLLSIQELLQTSVLDANTADAALATHVRKMRENGLPTEAELATWPPPPTAEEKERLRAKARQLLVTRGLPQALTSVMGAAASGEALGRVFDALQVERVGRALMFALMLQGIRAVTQ